MVSLQKLWRDDRRKMGKQMKIDSKMAGEDDLFRQKAFIAQHYSRSPRFKGELGHVSRGAKWRGARPRANSVEFHPEKTSMFPSVFK